MQISIFKKFFISIKKLNLSLKELELKAKNRGMKGYRRMSIDKLLSILYALEPIRKHRTIKDPKNIQKQETSSF